MDPSDPFRNRLAELHRMPALERIVAIDAELKALSKVPTTAVVFHRKKLVRMSDAARMEAGLVTPSQLQRENSSFANVDFTAARIVWRPRVHA
jgi:hypothetical protein